MTPAGFPCLMVNRWNLIELYDSDSDSAGYRRRERSEGRRGFTGAVTKKTDVSF